LATLYQKKLFKTKKTNNNTTVAQLKLSKNFF
jgi:hypothetical protein